MKRENRTYRRPSVGLAVLIMLVIVGSLVGMILANISLELAMFISSMIGLACCLLLGRSWDEVEQQIIRSISSVAVPVLILVCVGINVAA